MSASEPNSSRRSTAAQQPDSGRAARRAITACATLLWTAVVLVPIYWVVVTSLRSRADFVSASPLVPPRQWTWSNYRTVISDGFGTYLFNSVVVTVVAVAVAVAVVASLMAAFVIVHHAASRWSRLYFRLFLLGLTRGHTRPQHVRYGGGRQRHTAAAQPVVPRYHRAAEDRTAVRRSAARPDLTS